MTTTESLPKTQAATLREIARINDSDEPAVEWVVERKGIHCGALRQLDKKGLTYTHSVDLVGTFVLVSEAGYAWLKANPE